MKTFSIKASQIQKNWFLIDASGLVVGRLAAFIATVLRGKNKPEYTPHMDCGDNIVVINADKICFTGDKLSDKVYRRHTGHPGGIKTTTPAQILSTPYSARILELAVKRMLGKGVLARKRLDNLYIYAGSEHKQQAQNPIVLDFAELNIKNKKRN